MQTLESPLSAEVRKEIESRNRAFELAYSRADARALVEDYFVDDRFKPLASPPGRQSPVRGREALITMFAGMFRDAPSIRLETVDLETSTDMAHELGRAHLTLRSGEKAFGRYTVLWINADHEWRARIDFFAPDGWRDY